MIRATQKTAVLAYVPVLHEGYLKFFHRHPEADQLILVGDDLTAEIEAFQKDIRALPAAEMKLAIQSLGIFKDVTVAGKNEIHQLSNDELLSWIMPDEELMYELADTYLAGRKVGFDTTFLRWDKKSILAEKPVVTDKFMKRTEFLREKSADWWRQVGGVIVKDGQILLEAWNQHVPSSLEPYFQGDPRASFHKGEQIELSTAIHSEATLVAQAAKQGLSIAGTDLYTTTFPCPVCAKLIAAAGIKKVYFQEGYAMLDGESILQASGVEIIKLT